MKFGIFRSSDTNCQRPPHPASRMLFPYTEEADGVLVETRGIYTIEFGAIHEMVNTIDARMVIHKKADVLANFEFLDTPVIRWPDEIEWVIEIYDDYRE